MRASSGVTFFAMSWPPRPDRVLGGVCYPYTAIGSPIMSGTGTAPIPGSSGAIMRPSVIVGALVTVIFCSPFG